MSNFKEYKNLIKYIFRTSFKLRQIIIFLSILTIGAYIVMNSTSILVCKSGFSINCWDLVFRVLTNPFFIILMLIPVIIAITINSISNKKYTRYALIRNSSIRKYILSQFIAESFIVIGMVLSIIIIIFVISIIKAKFEFGWSSVIKNVDSTEIMVTALYPNNFITNFTTVQSLVIVFLEYVLTSIFVINMRNLIYYITKNFYITIILIGIFLIYSIESFGEPKIFSLANMGCIWYHNFWNGFDISLITGDSNLNLMSVQSSFLTTLISIIFMIIIILKRVRMINAENL